MKNEINEIALCLNEEKTIILNKEGFYYKGEKIDDIHNVYERFNDWLNDAAKLRNDGISNVD